MSLVSTGEVVSLEHKGKVSVNYKSMFVPWKPLLHIFEQSSWKPKTIWRRNLMAALSKINANLTKVCLQRVWLKDQEPKLSHTQSSAHK